jgi:hypothetical protein
LDLPDAEDQDIKDEIIVLNSKAIETGINKTN